MRQSVHSGEVASLTRRPDFTSQEDSWYTFLLEAESTPGLGKAKKSVTSSEIKYAIFWLVV
jgi:hypothetical protein